MQPRRQMEYTETEVKSGDESILFPHGLSNPWQAMVKTVRDVDKRKVTDIKEDIDTLLVFAGLFSAVVTTFVVATYPTLQPDSTDELVLLMRHSLAQNYTFSDGILRPVSPIPVDPVFEVPPWALRVNGLWFASLIVSLSTASFGMLVKQWLTEYLAMEWISPEEQLRARQYRHPGLRTWRVFEIAAILPLLLHISLGLFFVGLCFFTAAAHESIGRSTLPLVAGWAFFALMTVVAPLTTPRCPYKVTLLKGILQAGRHILRAIWRVGTHLFLTVRHAARTYPKLSIHPRTATRFDRLGSLLAKVFKSLPLRIVLLIPLIPFMILAQASLPFLALSRVIGLASLKLARLCVSLLGQFARSLDRVGGAIGDEEKEAVRQDYKVHELLLSVDRVLIDDGLMLETMSEVLRQTHISPMSMMTFILGCIKHRIGEAKSNNIVVHPHGFHVNGLLDLRPLSQNAWDRLVGLTGLTLNMHLQWDVEIADSCLVPKELWPAYAVAVLFSDSARDFPPPLLTILSSDTALAKLLQCARPLTRSWDIRDVISLVWIALAARKPRSLDTPSAIIARDWNHLQFKPHSARDVGVLQRAVIQVLLQSFWCADSRSEQLVPHVEEATTMLLTALLSADSTTRARPIPQYNSLDQYSIPLRTHRAFKDDGTIGLHLGEEPYVPMASKLMAAIGQSPDLIEGALQLYRAFITGGVLNSRCRTLQETLRDMTMDDFQVQSLRPIFLDLWRFILKCARSSTEDVGFLRQYNVVSLCLVLAQPGIPRAFGRSDPAHDWTLIASALPQSVHQIPAPSYPLGSAMRHRVMQDDSARVSSLARRALRRLRRLGNDQHDIPDVLINLLSQLKLEPERQTASAGFGIPSLLAPRWSELSSHDSDTASWHGSSASLMVPTSIRPYINAYDEPPSVLPIAPLPLSATVPPAMPPRTAQPQKKFSTKAAYVPSPAPILTYSRDFSTPSNVFDARADGHSVLTPNEDMVASRLRKSKSRVRLPGTAASVGNDVKIT